MSRITDEAEVAKRIVDRGTKAAEVVISHEPSLPVSAPPPAVEKERRAKPRYSVNLSVTLVGDSNFYLGISENLSEGGLFVRTQQILSIGSRIKVEFTLPTSPQPLSLTGTIRWVRSPDAVREEYNNYGSVDDTSSKPGMGIQFDALDREATEAITKFIRYRRPEFYEA